MKIGFRYAYLGHQHGFVDIAHDGYQLRQMLDLSSGKVIFRDTFDQYGALWGYVNTAAFMMFGRTLLAVKDFVVVWYALIAVAMFVLARHWLGPILSGFTVVFWLSISPFFQHGVMISPHVYLLFLQVLATIVIVDSPSLSPNAFAIAGILTGMSFGMKQTIAVFYVAAIIAYLLLLVIFRRDSWRRILSAGLAFVAGFAVVIAAVLGALFTRGALRDWYLQTVVFPRAFYTPTSSAVFFAKTFLSRQVQQEVFWFVIRGVVFTGVLIQLLTRGVANDLLLMASLTAFLWLGAYPSANFMHQWWTVSLALPAFVVILNDLFLWMSGGVSLRRCHCHDSCGWRSRTRRSVRASEDGR